MQLLLDVFLNFKLYNAKIGLQSKLENLGEFRIKLPSYLVFLTEEEDGEKKIEKVTRGSTDCHSTKSKKMKLLNFHRFYGSNPLV
jgi:hypothetical protein